MTARHYLLAAILALLPAPVAADVNRVVLSEDGTSAVLWEEGGYGIRFFGQGEGRMHLLPKEILGVFPDPLGWIVVGNQAYGGFGAEVVVVHLSADMLKELGRANLGVFDVSAADLRDGMLYLGDRNGQGLELVNVCLALQTCKPANAPANQSLYFYAPPIDALAIDPTSQLAVLVSAEFDSILVADLDSFSSKGGTEPVLSGAHGRVTLSLSSGRSVKSDELGRPARIYVGVPSDETVLTGEFDADFRSLRPTGTIVLRDFVSTPAPLRARLNAAAQVPVDMTRPGVARVAASADGGLILVAGVEKRVVHILALNGNAVTRIADVEVDGPVVDVDVTENGRFGAVLSEGGIVLFATREVTDQARVAEMHELGARSRIEAMLVAAVQKRLIEEGFLIGVVDGILGPQTSDALVRYADSAGISLIQPLDRESALSTELLGRLFVGSTNDLPPEFAASAEGHFVILEAFKATLAQESPDLRDLNVLELLMSKSGECKSPHQFPPESLWLNISKAVLALNDLRALGYELEVVNAYQIPANAECAGVPESLQDAASQFRTLALRFPADQDAEELVKSVASNEAITAHLEGGLMWIVAEAPIERLGRWHAVIASHNLNTAACNRAKDDVAEFASLLAGTSAAGLPLYIARTVQSPYYAVTVDTGNSEQKAREVSALVRELSVKSADRRTGADSIVLTNRGWSIDNDCRFAVFIQPAE